MNQYEYEKALCEINKKHEKEKSQLNYKYAKEDQKYEIGDTIKSRQSSIVVDEIKWGFGFNKKLPEMIYLGFELTKKGGLRKDKSRARIYQIDVICNN